MLLILVVAFIEMVGETETGTADAAKLTDIEMSPSKDQQVLLACLFQLIKPAG